MITDSRIERAGEAYERSVYAGDTSMLADAEEALNAVEADTALALGKIAHARFQCASGDAREQLEESSRLDRDTGNLPGVASNLIGLAYIAAAQNRRTNALATLDEAQAIAHAHEAHAIVRHIEQARTVI